jgi:hypothetical protein
LLVGDRSGAGPDEGARVARSRRAVTEALAWQAHHGALAGNILTGAEFEALGAVFAAHAPIPAGLFAVMIRLGLTAFRCALELGAPACGLGDVLTVAAALPSGHGLPWTPEPTVDAEAFEKLRFRQVSEGIVRTQRANRAGWGQHAERSRAFIGAAARGVASHECAVILGAGHAFDLPLAELARQFEHLVLVDVDEAALAATIETEVPDRGLRAKIEPRIADVTGIDGAMVHHIDQAFAAGGSARDVEERLAAVCASYRLPGGPPLLAPGERADLLVSGLLLSQIAWPQRVYAHRLFCERFDRPAGEAERRWIAPFWEFELLLQQDHINALTRCADRAVLISDVASLPTTFDQFGVQRDTGLRVCGLGVDRLGERLPRFLGVVGQGEWSWPRYPPDGRGRLGSRMEIEAMVLCERPSPPG